MQLNKFTDYGLRILVHIAQPREQLYTIQELANYFHISQNHLVKIVHFMSKQHWIITTRGKHGGLQIDERALHFPLGDMIRILQDDPPIVNCAEPPCVLRANCGLKSILDQALYQFYHSLNQYTLAQILKLPAKERIPLFNIAHIDIN